MFCTYRGTEDQCDVFVVPDGSERNLRQGVVVLRLRQRRIQEHHVILRVKNTLSLQHQQQSEAKIRFKGKSQFKAANLLRCWSLQHERGTAGTPEITLRCPQGK